MYLKTIFHVYLHCIWTYIFWLCRKKLSKSLKLCAFILLQEPLKSGTFCTFLKNPTFSNSTLKINFKKIQGGGGIPWHPPPPKNHACRIGGVEESGLLLICACRWDNSLCKKFQYLSQEETLLFSQQKCDLKVPVAKLQIFNCHPVTFPDLSVNSWLNDRVSLWFK